jgi:hypothetical protein
MSLLEKKLRSAKQNIISWRVLLIKMLFYNPLCYYEFMYMHSQDYFKLMIAKCEIIEVVYITWYHTYRFMPSTWQ